MTGRRAPYDVTARSALDRLIRRTAAWQTLRDLRRHYEVWRWYRAGRPSPPPPLVKQAIVKDYALRFALRTLIETGTYRGDMVNACRETFETIVSIELDEVLFEEARRRFAKYPHVAILHGDSGPVLMQTLPTILTPCLFWLDGHYCAHSQPPRSRVRHSDRRREMLRWHTRLPNDRRVEARGAEYPSRLAVRNRERHHQSPPVHVALPAACLGAASSFMEGSTISASVEWWLVSR